MGSEPGTVPGPKFKTGPGPIIGTRNDWDWYWDQSSGPEMTGTGTGTGPGTGTGRGTSPGPGPETFSAYGETP